MTEAVIISYRNQSIDLQRKSMDWFLYDNGLRHERLNWKINLQDALATCLDFIKIYITKALGNKLEVDTIKFTIVSDAKCPYVRYITPTALV